MLRCSFILVAALLLPVQFALAESTAAAPERVIILSAAQTGKVQISWLPPTGDVPEGYRVYGYLGSTQVLLTETIGLTATVGAGYAGYAVSAVTSGGESPPEPASNCLDIDPNDLPPVQVNPACN